MNNLRYLGWLGVFLICISCTTVTKHPVATDTAIQRVTSQEMIALMKNDKIRVIDVRTPQEFETGYIETAENIDFKDENFINTVSKLDTSKPVIIYCARGGRSAKCAEVMKEAGFTKIYDLNGGISQWKLDGQEIIN
ncbi:rhodanese-like domain-containing protein [Aquimarina sp. W85]|uniref:rhodanese-like domain-containing protein n=1 Tax=Aquimarina rhodophyticola TaxID=3342246 RepID=UPI0036735A57